MEGEGRNDLIQGLQNQNQEQQLHPPHRCPRCNSLNTKFCYFNNYNQSQPRYFCKACRRYWTQGGTLRNVPFGGGCRRGRRARVAASSGEAVRSLPATPVAPALQQLAPAPLQPVQLQPNLTSAPPNVVGVRESGSMVPNFPMPPLTTPYYHGPAVDDGGYLSSLLSNNKSLNMGAAGTSNSSAMPGVNINPFSYQQQQRQIQPQPLYQMSNWERNISAMHRRQPGLTQSGMPAGGSGLTQPYWSQNFMNDANHCGSVSDASVPNSVNTTSMNANPDGSSAAGSSLVPNQWPKMPEYDPSP